MAGEAESAYMSVALGYGGEVSPMRPCDGILGRWPKLILDTSISDRTKMIGRSFPC